MYIEDACRTCRSVCKFNLLHAPSLPLPVRVADYSLGAASPTAVHLATSAGGGGGGGGGIVTGYVYLG